jgi:hypothetical protein
MDFLYQQFYPNAKETIKFQYRTTKGDLYVITEGKNNISLYHNNKKIKESDNYQEVIKLVSEGGSKI